MAEEIINGGNPTEQTNENQKYLDAIAELKKNSVSRAEYDKIRDENTMLLNSIVSGKSLETTSAEEANKPTIEELRKKYFNLEGHPNLDCVQTILDVRDATIERGDKDPFLAFGQKIAPNEEDINKANNVAKVLHECIEYANGDDQLFTNELQRRIIDVMPARRR